MAVVWMEGFELFGNLSNLQKKYVAQGLDGSTYTDAACQVELMSGRVSGQSMSVPGSNIFKSPSLDSLQVGTIGFGVMFANDGYSQIANFNFNSSLNSTHFSIYKNANNYLTSSRSTSVINYYPVALTTNTWYYVEVQFKIDPINGFVVVRLNGQEVLNFTGMNTRNPNVGHGFDFVDCVLFEPSYTIRYDDIYLCDTLGSASFDFLGPCQVKGYVPSDNGSNAQWVPSTLGAANYAVVNNQVPDGTSYIYSSASDVLDTYHFPNQTTIGHGVAAVEVGFLGMTTGSNASVAPVVRPELTNYFGTAQTLQNSYRYYRHIFNQNPDTNSEWTTFDLNIAEFGVNRTT